MSSHLAGPVGAEERTALARRYTDNAEAWLRRLVHDKLAPASTYYLTTGNFSNELKNWVAAEYRKNPGKFTREIDATTFGLLVKLVCNLNHWPTWSDALTEAYPGGHMEARTYLERLHTIRNTVSHGQMCSGRQLEQAICYSNDLSDSIKNHFRSKGMSRDFDVPTFVRVYDNLGNDQHLTPGPSFRDVDFATGKRQPLYPGDTLIVEVEVDPSFEPGGFNVIWWNKSVETGYHPGLKLVLPIELRHVRERMELQFKLATKLLYHRSGDVDDVIDVYYKVLPLRA